MMRSAVTAAATAAAATTTTTTTTALRQNVPSGMMACNVYVSAAAGHRKHPDVLLQLLANAQTQCQQLRGHNIDDDNNRSSSPPSQHSTDSNIVSIVHAFADVVYNRSSFHLAGTPWMVQEVASKLALDAMHHLSQLEHACAKDDDNNNENHTVQKDSNKILPHPSVGWVDHVSVMPLRPIPQQLLHSISTDHALSDLLDSSSTTLWQEQLSMAGDVARNIGHRLANNNNNDDGGGGGVHVLYYGHAHPDGLPLAQVRRQSTNFFHSGAPVMSSTNTKTMSFTTKTTTTTNENNNNDGIHKMNVATVGAPTHGFTENCNIRLSSTCSWSMAKSLTKFVRERDGSGLVGIEALTLPYSYQRWEVACNLLQPSVSDVEALLRRALEWDKKNMKNTPNNDNSRSHSSSEKVESSGQHDRNSSPMLLENLLDSISSSRQQPYYWIETAYRVGTTEQQCWQVLMEHASNDLDTIKAHDQRVLERLRSYLLD